MSDPLLDLIKDVVVKLGGKPGTHKWEVVTAIFGWGAGFALVAWIITSLLGFEDTAKWLLGAFSFLFGIAFKRDLIKLFTTGRMTE